MSNHQLTDEEIAQKLLSFGGSMVTPKLTKKHNAAKDVDIDVTPRPRNTQETIHHFDMIRPPSATDSQDGGEFTVTHETWFARPFYYTVWVSDHVKVTESELIDEGHYIRYRYYVWGKEM